MKEHTDLKFQLTMVILLRPDIFKTIIAIVFVYVLQESKGQNMPHVLVCGRSFRVYDPLTQECVNGHVYSKSSPSSIPSAATQILPDQTPDHSPSAATQNQTSVRTKITDRWPRRTCRSTADILNCNGKLYCDGTLGYRCCGFELFHPNNQTCCQETSAHYKIHNKPEKNHMCCNLEVYERGHSSSACPHPGANDRFFKKPKKLTSDQKICQESTYVFRIKITRHRRRELQLEAKVGVWRWPPVRTGRIIHMEKRPPWEVEMDIMLDKYSPKKKLSKKTFLVFSEHQYLNDAVLFLNANDAIYKCSKRCRNLVRKLKRVYRKCN